MISPIELHFRQDESLCHAYHARMNLDSRSKLFDSYWIFSEQRHRAYMSRISGQPQPWSTDDIITRYRFTNVYRASDRVSQYLIKHVQYAHEATDDPVDVIFRTLLFKIFNNISTWETLSRELGIINYARFDFEKADQILSRKIDSGATIYSAAYIMPSPPFGAMRKHSNHLRLIKEMMEDGIANKILQSNNLERVYNTIKSYPGLGSFLAFQFSIDINYSTAINFDENDFVVAGPGALDGIRKCFPQSKPDDAEKIIYWMVENQDKEFDRLGIDFPGLFGRKLKAIDCQNIFCEISKYGRVAFPDIVGISNRTRIKQVFNSRNRRSLPQPFFPPKWNITVPDLGGQDEDSDSYQLELGI